MKTLLTHPDAARPLLLDLAMRPVEEIWTLALGPALELLGVDATFKGTRDRCLFHPREVFEFVIRRRASSFILAHNHPSGSARPSPEDFNVTRRMVFLSQALQIPMVDHLIVTSAENYSFRKHHRVLFEKFSVVEKCTDEELVRVAGSAVTEPLPPRIHGRVPAEPV